VIGRKAAKAARGNVAKSDFPSLPPPNQVPRRLPPLRKAALIVKVKESSSFEDTVRAV